MTSVRRFVPNLLEASALWGIAVVQPILSILSGNTDFFLRNAIVGWRVIAFAVAFALVPPIAIVIAEFAFVRTPRVATTFHLAVLGLLGLAGIQQFVKYGADFEGTRLYVVTACVAALAIVSWWRLAFLREWLRWLGVVPLVVALIFVFSSPVGRFARAGDGRLADGTGSTTPVVMIMFDEFPLASLLDGSGRIDAVSYPNFARLAGMSTWYRMYSTTAEETQFAVPTSLSGISARTGLGATYADHPDSIFSLLGRSHAMHVTESITKLCPPAVCATVRSAPNWTAFFDGVFRLFRQRVDGTLANEFDNVTDNPVLDDKPATHLDVPTPEVQTQIPGLFRDVLTEWTSQLEASPVPTLHYVHVLLPHQPWVLTPGGDFYSAAFPRPVGEETAWDVKVLRQRHLLQLRFLDSLVGNFLDRLESQGVLDDALVVVTADHGTSFVRGHVRRYAVGDYSNAPEIMSVPLFIKSPGEQRGSIDDSDVDNEDLMSLIADRLGVDIPWTMNGTLPTAGDTGPKTLKFVVPPIGQEMRPDPGFTISFAAFRERVMSFGSAAVVGDPLSYLYRGSPHDGLRGRMVASLGSRLSPVDVRLGREIESESAFVVVEGKVDSVSDGSWLAVASGGRVVGLAPVQHDGTFVTVVLDGDGSPVDDPSFFVID